MLEKELDILTPQEAREAVGGSRSAGVVRDAARFPANKHLGPLGAIGTLPENLAAPGGTPRLARDDVRRYTSAMIDELKLVRVLADGLDSDEDISRLAPNKDYYLATPYGASGAGRELLQAMEHAGQNRG